MASISAALPSPRLPAIFLVSVRRQLPVFLVLIACCAMLGLFYLFTTPSSYTATATMVIDTRKVQLFQQRSVLGETPVDAGTVQTQVEVLKSQNVSLAVIRDLHLTDDPEFVSSGSGLMGAVVSAVTGVFGVRTLPRRRRSWSARHCSPSRAAAPSTASALLM